MILSYRKLQLSVGGRFLALRIEGGQFISHTQGFIWAKKFGREIEEDELDQWATLAAQGAPTKRGKLKHNPKSHLSSTLPCK